ncbi:MAG: CBS domain-containing protein [Armatimonadetes bacterium]|nr:CBS domain-containing protein [Armatimonadota bacterium]
MITQRPRTDFITEHFRRTEQLVALCMQSLRDGRGTLAKEYFSLLREELDEQSELEERRVHIHYPEDSRRELARQHRDLRSRLMPGRSGGAAIPDRKALQSFRLRLLDHLAVERSCLAAGGLLPSSGRTKIARVEDLMQKEVVCVPLEMSITELARLLTSRRISGAPVIDPDGKLVGVVSLVDVAIHVSQAEMDLTPVHYSGRWWKDGGIDQDSLFDGFMVQEFSSSTSVADIMTPAAYQIAEDAELLELVDLMLAGGIHRAIVTRGGQVVGIVTTTDLMRFLRGHLVSGQANAVERP